MSGDESQEARYNSVRYYYFSRDEFPDGGLISDGNEQVRFIRLVSEQLLNPDFPKFCDYLLSQREPRGFSEAINTLLRHRNDLLALYEEYDDLDAQYSAAAFSEEHALSTQENWFKMPLLWYQDEVDRWTVKLAPELFVLGGVTLKGSLLGQYLAMSIREIAPVPMLLAPEGSSFARSTYADLPYADDIVLGTLLGYCREVANFCKTRNIVVSHDDLGLWLYSLQAGQEQSVFHQISYTNKGNLKEEGACDEFISAANELWQKQKFGSYDRIIGSAHSSIGRAADVFNELIKKRRMI